MENMNIGFSPPDISEEEINEVIDALKSGWITTGPKTKKFEQQIAEYCHTNKAVCLNSATACMELTLRLLGVQEGDEVITSAYTYSASASVIHHVGARVVLVDTQENSYQMNYDKLESAITEKTKVIIPVDIGGAMCDYNQIFDIVERKKKLFIPANEIQKGIGRITVMADAAHSFGAVSKGKCSGEVADFTSFSFHAVKNLTTAEGGAVVWCPINGIDDEWIYKQFMLMSLHGQSKDALAKTQLGAWEYDIVEPFYKCNMTDIMASIGVAQLKRYPSILQKRKEIIESYNHKLEGYNVNALQHYGDNFASSGHLYLVNLIGKNRTECNEIINHLAQKGIATNVHYKPLPMLTAYKKMGFKIEDYPCAYSLFNNEITLPLHTKLTDCEVEYIMEVFCKSL